MKFFEIYPRLLHGKKIYRKSWNRNNYYMEIDYKNFKDGKPWFKYTDEEGVRFYDSIRLSDIMADDWLELID
jgi:hypothetical protein